MIEVLEQETKETTQVRGYSAQEDPLFEAMVELAEDAVERIHGITLTQVDRWREQDPKQVAEKLPAFWEKQRTRLTEALAPADTLARKTSGELRCDVSWLLSTHYVAKYSKLDNYSVFDPANAAHGLDIHSLLKDELYAPVS